MNPLPVGADAHIGPQIMHSTRRAGACYRRHLPLKASPFKGRWHGEAVTERFGFLRRSEVVAPYDGVGQ